MTNDDRDQKRLDEEMIVLPQDPGEIQRTGVDIFTRQLGAYLEHLELPVQGVLVAVEQRQRVMQNLPAVVNLLTVDARRGAFYVSKFVAACGVGLFDAALNFMWDETVVSLRGKVVRYDLTYFFDSLFTDPDRRKEFGSEEDLIQLDDWQLVKGCRNIGVLSDVGFRHLDYIRDMRNWASAAHPNQVELTGLQLVTWLETCVREVLAREPSAPAIQVQQLIQNVRTQVLTQNDVAPIAARIIELPADIASSLLRTLAGMFTDPRVAADAKNNIRLIAPALWQHAPEQARHEVGLKYSRFGANADVQRREAVREFLTLVGGLTFLPPDALALEISERVQTLENAHLGFNNFYNEPLPARTLASYVPENGAIPDTVRADYVRVVTLAFIGNRYGVSNAAEPVYRLMISRFGEAEIRQFLRLTENTEFVSRLEHAAPAARFQQVARDLRARTVEPYTGEALDLLTNATIAQVPRLGRTTRFLQALERMPNP